MRPLSMIAVRYDKFSAVTVACTRYLTHTCGLIKNVGISGVMVEVERPGPRRLHARSSVGGVADVQNQIG
jgi:hypothetical protein